MGSDIVIAVVTFAGLICAAMISGAVQLRKLTVTNTMQHKNNQNESVATRHELDLMRVENAESHRLLIVALESLRDRVDHHVDREESEMWPQIIDLISDRLP